MITIMTISMNTITKIMTMTMKNIDTRTRTFLNCKHTSFCFFVEESSAYFSSAPSLNSMITIVAATSSRVLEIFNAATSARRPYARPSHQAVLGSAVSSVFVPAPSLFSAPSFCSAPPFFTRFWLVKNRERAAVASSNSSQKKKI